MNKTNEPNPTTPEMPGPGDPRFGLAQVTSTVASLMEATPADAMGLPTPCEEFAVKELSEHLVLVMRRIAVLGNGEHWSTIEQMPQDSGWAESFRSAAHDVMEAWTDPAKMEAVYEVPWGEMPGAPLLLTYTAELAVHAWDLASATGQALAIDDAVLEGAWVAAQFIPADARGPEVPFGEVVRPADDAATLLKIAGWLGRNVNEPFGAS